MTGQLRVDIQDGGQQSAMPAADVDDAGEPGPVESGDDLRDLLAEALGHLTVERLAQVRLVGKVSPKVLPVAARVASLAGA